MPKHTEKQPIKVEFDVTESAANTYTTDEILLPVEPSSGLVFDMESIELEISAPAQAANVLGTTSAQFTRSEQGSILGGDDDDLIAKIVRYISNNSANANFWTFLFDDRIGFQTRERLNLLAVRKIHLGILSTNQASAKRVRGFLVGNLVRVDQKELTSLLLEQVT